MDHVEEASRQKNGEAFPKLYRGWWRCADGLYLVCHRAAFCCRHSVWYVSLLSLLDRIYIFYLQDHEHVVSLIRYPTKWSKTLETLFSLSPCPNRPNCVSSETTDPVRFIEPIKFLGSPADVWVVLKFSLQSLPRTYVVEESGWYLRAEAKSRLFGFVDDVEFVMNVRSGVIHVRSASRTGYSDLGVNRKRIERVRKMFGSLHSI